MHVRDVILKSDVSDDLKTATIQVKTELTNKGNTANNSKIKVSLINNNKICIDKFEMNAGKVKSEESIYTDGKLSVNLPIYGVPKYPIFIISTSNLLMNMES